MTSPDSASDPTVEPAPRSAGAGSDRDGVTRMIDWWFRDRRTGALVIAQFPNPALWVWLGCVAVQAFGDLTGDSALLVRGAGRAALAIWALDEIVRGCNPFRRVLGAVVLTVSAIGWFGV